MWCYTCNHELELETDCFLALQIGHSEGNGWWGAGIFGAICFLVSPTLLIARNLSPSGGLNFAIYSGSKWCGFTLTDQFSQKSERCLT